MKSQSVNKIIAESGYKRNLIATTLALSNRIRAAIKARGWSQRQLADTVGILPESLSRMLGGAGTNLTLDSIAKLEYALEIPLLVTPDQYEQMIKDNPKILARIQRKMGVTRSESGIPVNTEYGNNQSNRVYSRDGGSLSEQYVTPEGMLEEA